MKKLIYSVLFLFLCLQFNLNAQCNADDFYALKDIYTNMDGDNWADNSGWDLVKNNASPPSSCDFSSLFGVEVDPTTSRVTSIILSDNKLNGSIPASIGDLEFLQVLGMGDSTGQTNTFINGTIPDEICNLSNLSTLVLENHELTGSIPDSIGKMSSLITCILHSNSLHPNKLTGPIPTSIGQCSALYSFYANNNDFSGNLPATLINCTSLQNLYVSNSMQTAQPFPSFLNNIPSLRRLRLSYNNYTGSLPYLGNLNLLQFHVINNDLSGSLPAYMSNWTNVRELLLGNNNFSGPLPSGWGSMSNLDYLLLDGNPLNSSIPASWSGMTFMRLFRASNCGLTGNIPPIFANMPRLYSLRMVNNSFTGDIPDVFQNKPNLRDVRLQDNMLSGSIPPSFGDMPPGGGNPTVLYLYNNQLTGCFDANLLNLCNPDTAYAISVNIGNNLDDTWQNFCSSGAGICATGSATFCDISNGKDTELSVEGNACIDGVLNASEGIQLTPLMTAPTSPALGQMYFDGNTNTLRYWNGITWVTL